MRTTLRQRLGRDLLHSVGDVAAAFGLPDVPPGGGPVVTEEDVAGLPPVVRRYLAFMGVVGRPRDLSFRSRFTGRFRLRQDAPWLPCDALQYNTAEPVARIFHMRVDFAGFVPMVGHDTYLGGRARMYGHLLGLVPVLDGTGREYDLGELVTWVDDALSLAPSMLLTPATTWTEVDGHTFDVAFTDSGLTVSARVTVDDDGRMTGFVTEDRWLSGKHGLVHAPWSTPVDGWTEVAGRPVPTSGRAVWLLPEGGYTYAEAAFADPVWNVSPSPSPHRRRPLRAVGEVVGGGAAVAAALATSPLARKAYNRWGATAFEEACAMPGDDLVPEPRLGYTRAVTVDAPPETVWQWLVQIGQGRAGLYSYDALENLVGCDLHSADRVVPELQDVRPGDAVRLHARDEERAYRVVEATPPSALVLYGGDGETFGITWQWVLRPADDGRRTRLVVRQRLTFPDGQRRLWRVVEPIGFAMEHRMLHGIKERAEAAARELVSTG